MDPILRLALWRLLYRKRPPGFRAISNLLGRRRSKTLRDALQDVFEQYARRVARMAALGQDSRWPERARRAVRNQLIAQHSFAARRAPLPSELLEIAEGPLKEQLRFLENFVDEVKATPVKNRSEAQIGNRLSLYSGAGRAEFFRGEESDAGGGDVVDYVALDDKGTCYPCLLAAEQGPYRPGEGPYPGEVCLGRGRCRCERSVRYSPGAAARLREAAA